MKQAIGGAAVLAGVAWLLFVFTTPEPCERIQRAASPVRISFDVARWAAKNWLSTESRIDMIRWSLSADAATQRFMTRQFYGEGAQCVEVKASEENNTAQSDGPERPGNPDLPAVKLNTAKEKQ